MTFMATCRPRDFSNALYVAPISPRPRGFSRMKSRPSLPGTAIRAPHLGQVMRSKAFAPATSTTFPQL